jgi:hypothetical protein
LRSANDFAAFLCSLAAEPQQFLYFALLPQGHVLLRGGCFCSRSRCCFCVLLPFFSPAPAASWKLSSQSSASSPCCALSRAATAGPSSVHSSAAVVFRLLAAGGGSIRAAPAAICSINASMACTEVACRTCTSDGSNQQCGHCIKAHRHLLCKVCIGKQCMRRALSTLPLLHVRAVVIAPGSLHPVPRSTSCSSGLPHAGAGGAGCAPTDAKPPLLISRAAPSP